MNKKHLILALPLLAIALLASCSDSPATKEGGEETAAAGEYERGPHRGRMLRDGDFALEITLFEDGVDPELRVYAYRGDKPDKPGEVQLSMQLDSLGGKIDKFASTPREDFLRSEVTTSELQSLLRH